MRLSGHTGFLELERCEFPSDTPADSDLLLNVTVDVRGFAAQDQAWILGAEWAAFIGNVRLLDRNRQGRVRVESMSPGEFVIEIFSTDRAGHMALTGKVRRPHVDGFTLALEFGFAFDPGLLSTLAGDLANLSPPR